MDVLIAPETCDRLVCIKLPQPTDGKIKQFLYDEENLKLYEVTKYSDPFRSWFLDNKLCKEGHFNILTKVDPLFIFIPQLIKYVSTQFRSLYDICSTYNNELANSTSDKLEYALNPDIDWTLICDTREFDDEILVRYNETKTLDWLLKKHEKTFQALKVELSNLVPSTATLISYASDLIENYIPPELSSKLKTQAKNKYTTSDSNPTYSSTSRKPDHLNGESKDSKIVTKRASIESPSTKYSSVPKGSVLNFFKQRK